MEKGSKIGGEIVLKTFAIEHVFQWRWRFYFQGAHDD